LFRTEDVKSPLRSVILVGSWLLAAAAGFAFLLEYDSTPEAQAGAASEVWPGTSALARASGRQTLLVFLHPRCPCSGATLDELAEIAAELPRDAEVRAVFVVPEGAPDDWAAGKLRTRATTIAGVSVEDDLGGVEAARFGARSSGTALLYDRGGRLAFRGGITRSRGHAGDNPGRRSVAALLAGRDAEAARTPVFGCPLADETGGAR
jgi:hypothetical protein